MSEAGDPRGIFLVSRPMAGKTGGAHFAVIFFGEWPMNLHEDGCYYPVIVELSPPRISLNWYQGGWWTIHGQVVPEEEAAALWRLELACSNNPDYALLVSNCEQFARWVTTGVWENKQLQAVGMFTAVAAFGVLAVRTEIRGRRAG